MLFFQIIGFIILVVLLLLFLGFVAFEMSPIGNKLNIFLNWIFNHGIPNLGWFIILLIPLSIILSTIIGMYIDEREKGVDRYGLLKNAGIALTQLPFVYWIGCFGPGRPVGGVNTGLAVSLTAWTAVISLGVIILHYLGMRLGDSEAPQGGSKKPTPEDGKREREANEEARRRDASYAAERAARMAEWQ